MTHADAVVATCEVTGQSDGDVSVVVGTRPVLIPACYVLGVDAAGGRVRLPRWQAEVLGLPHEEQPWYEDKP